MYQHVCPVSHRCAVVGWKYNIRMRYRNTTDYILYCLVVCSTSTVVR